MISALNRLTNGNIELTITIPWKQVKTSYDSALTKLAQNVEIKGFRKGKAPKKLVEKNLDQKKVYEQVLKDLLPEVYSQALSEHTLKPIIPPQIRLISAQEGKDWQIQAITCELPTIKLGDYQQQVRSSLTTEKIWVPGKDKKEENQKSKEDKIGKILKALTKIPVIVPLILLEDEVNQMLSRLIDQTGRLGLTVEQYLKSQNKTSEQLRAEYRQQAEDTLKLEFILSAIADKENIKVSQEEIEQMIKAVPEEKLRGQLNNPEQKLYIRQLLRKRKVIDKLSLL